jgi:hypothetical protein
MKKNIKYIKNLLYCIEGNISYEDLISDKYRDNFIIHLGYDDSDIKLLSNKEVSYIKEMIDEHNKKEVELFGDLK